MQRVDIPAGVTRIGDYVFQNCNSLKTLVCYPIEPPIIGNEVFFKFHEFLDYILHMILWIHINGPLTGTSTI